GHWLEAGGAVTVGRRTSPIQDSRARHSASGHDGELRRPAIPVRSDRDAHGLNRGWTARARSTTTGPPRAIRTSRDRDAAAEAGACARLTRASVAVSGRELLAGRTEEAPLRCDDALSYRELDQLRVAAEPELPHDLILVKRDRARGESQGARDLLHRAPLGEEPENLSLARCQLRAV